MERFITTILLLFLILFVNFIPKILWFNDDEKAETILLMGNSIVIALLLVEVVYLTN